MLPFLKFYQEFEPPQPKPESPPKRPPPGPRLEMDNYVYPNDFHSDGSGLERLKQIHTELLAKYKRTGKLFNELSQAKENYEWEKSLFNPCTHSYNENQIKARQRTLTQACRYCTLLIGELCAIGVPYHLPEELKDLIKVLKFADPGTLVYLPGVNFYFSESMANSPDPNSQWFQVKNMIVFMNRMIFLQHCGKSRYMGIYYADCYKNFKHSYEKLKVEKCGGCADCYKNFKRSYEKLKAENFNMELLPQLMEQAKETRP